jgi:general nucleoside transport system ATP-binding protein
MENTIELIHLAKSFGSVKANEDISLSIHRGEILALLGENGSGKTTLMNMLSGLYFPDSGQIRIDGKEVTIASPKDAFAHGIGMVHQHFCLIDTFTANQNIILGLKTTFFLHRKKTDAAIKAVADRYGFVIDLKKKIYQMSVSEKQTVEILKLLYRGVSTLILDEPTAVLTPQETEKLFVVLKAMKADGKSVIIITHKLAEVLSLSDRVAVLRKGKLVSLLETKDATSESLTDAMVGEHVELTIERAPWPSKPQTILDVQNLSTIGSDKIPTLSHVSFSVSSGEILGIAGVSGSGQKALLEAIAGLQKTEFGSTMVFMGNANQKIDLIGKSPKAIKKLGIRLAFVPEDRLGMGLVGDMGMTENMLLRSYEEGPSPFLSTKRPQQEAKDVEKKLAVSTPSLETPVRKLSGGNIQKVLVGREIASAPRLLLTAYATRGLDIATSYTIYNILNEQKKKGVAILYVGEDLDVLLALTDRIVVLSEGKVTGIVDSRTTDKKTLGLLMAGGKENPHD